MVVVEVVIVEEVVMTVKAEDVEEMVVVIAVAAEVEVEVVWWRWRWWRGVGAERGVGRGEACRKEKAITRALWL